MAMSPRLLRPLATGFNPKSISGLAFWLDAADSSTVTLVSGNVSAWASKSGSASPRTFTQSTANNRPTTTTVNGKAAIRFDGVNDSLGNTTADDPANRSLFAAVVRGSGTSLEGFYCGCKQNISLYGWYDTMGFSATNGYPMFCSRHETAGAGFRQVTTSASTSTPTIFTFQWVKSETDAGNFSSIVRRANGAADNAASAALAAYATGVYLGAMNQTPASGVYGDFFSGSICEILAYDAFLTSTQCTLVESYLKSKWGVSY
jgi:hypothetical protein